MHPASPQLLIIFLCQTFVSNFVPEEGACFPFGSVKGMRDNYTPVLKLKQKKLEMPMNFLHFVAATSPKTQLAQSAMLHAGSEAFE